MSCLSWSQLTVLIYRAADWLVSFYWSSEYNYAHYIARQYFENQYSRVVTCNVYEFQFLF